MITLRTVFDERMAEFESGYEWEDMNEALHALAGAGDLVSLVYGDASAQKTMSAILSIIAPADACDVSDDNGTENCEEWRKAWLQHDLGNGFPSSPLLEAIHDLNAFGKFGILPVWARADSLNNPDADSEWLQSRLSEWRDLQTAIEATCATIDCLELVAPRHADGGSSLNALLATRNLARTRLKYDAGESITIHELAALSGVTVKRIQNAVYAKTEEAPIVGKNGLIAKEACDTWLAARDYRASIWQQVTELGPLQPGWGEDVAFETAEENCSFDDYVIVPVALDGSIFHPGLARTSGGRDEAYTIGAKGAEQVVFGFDNALEALTSMATPRWRRPNRESGNWGIVSGQTWKRLRSSEFEALTR